MSVSTKLGNLLRLQEMREKKARPVRNVNDEHEQSLSRMERMATFVSDHVGSPQFFLLVITWTVCWLAWNALAPKHLRFDPFPAFVLWLFLSNVIQIFLMPLVMVAQNLQDRHAAMRADNDYEINVKAEMEIETLMAHLEYQNALLKEIAERLGIEAEEAGSPAAGG
jgi:uncharacterized membrane protein